MEKTRTRLLAAALAAASVAWAENHDYADAEVRKVDKDAGKVTLKHGPIPALDMPPMTMVFRVKQPAMLEKLKPGEKIRFRAEKVGGLYTIMGLQEEKK